MRRAIAAVLAAGVGLGGAAAHAQDDEAGLEQIYGDRTTISIATGQRQPIRRAPAVATVITAEDIAALGATDLDQVLETVPGLHVGRSSVDNLALYIIRGIFHRLNPQTLVLQNGVPMTTAFIGNRSLGWSSYPLDDIARIEIIRGPGSALYGADAYAGVINIITKSGAEQAGSEAGVRLGSFRQRDAFAQHGGRYGAIELAGYVRLGRTQGHRSLIEADAQTALDAVFGTHASLAPGPIHTGHADADARFELGWQRWKLRASYLLRDRLEPGAGIAEALDPHGLGRVDHGIVDLTLNEQPLGSDWRLNLAGSLHKYTQYHRQPLQLLPPGAFGGSFAQGMFGAPNTWERQWRFAASLGYTGFAQHRLRAGLGSDDIDLYRTQEFKNFNIITSGPAAGLPVPLGDGSVREVAPEDSFLLPHRRRVQYLYLQDEWDLAKDWALTTGVRHDRYSDFGGTTNPRLGLVWQPRFDLTVKLLHGRAFRAPAFNELFSINNPVERGNPALKPETIRTTEAVLAWQPTQRLQTQLSLFHYVMRDLIRALPDAGGVGSAYGNFGSQRGQGGEAELRWDATRALRLSGHVSWQHATDDATGAAAGYAPRLLAHLRADYSVQGWQLGLQAHRVADRVRAPGDARPPPRDYTSWDVSLRSPSFAGWQLLVSAYNLTDADRREPTTAPGIALPGDVPLAPRSLIVQASCRF